MSDIFISILVVFITILLAILIYGQVPRICRNDSQVNPNHGCSSMEISAYDIERVVAPVADCMTLRILSYIFTQTALAPYILRHLLNDNKIERIRELGSQISLPPLHFPVVRFNHGIKSDLNVLNKEQKIRDKVIRNGILIDNYSEASTAFDNDFKHYSIKHYAQAYRSTRLLPSQVMQKLLVYVKSLKTKNFHIFSSINETDVMAAAYNSDKRYQSNAPLSIFDGVPVAIKDMVDVTGHIIYDGKSPLDIHAIGRKIPLVDDILVTRLKNAGAIIFGVTIMTEGGVSPLGFNAHFQGPVNAYDGNHYSGGSSSGSAVAVASGIVPVAFGWDGGGSVRLPAACSGLHGLATTYGRIPFDSHIDSTMIKCGPMTNTAVDAALSYLLVSPAEPGHIFTEQYGFDGPPKPSIRGFQNTKDLSDVRIGIYDDWFNDSIPAISGQCRKVLDFFESRGAKLIPIKIPHLQTMRMSHAIKIGSEFASSWDKTYSTRINSIEPAIAVTIGIGQSVSAVEILAADKVRAWSMKYVRELYQAHNLTVIATPTMSILAPELRARAKRNGESDTGLTVEVMKYIFLANFLGMPAYTLPAGFASHEKTGAMLPIGFHMLGKHWHEHDLLRLANAFELGFSKAHIRPRPKYFVDALADDNPTI